MLKSKGTAADSVTLVKRTKRRKVLNYAQVEAISAAYAKSDDLQLIVHDDSSLPNLLTQLSNFARARVIIAPHGAGLLNLIATRRDTTVIEFIDYQSNVNLCYTRLSVLMGNRYHSISLSDGRADLEALNSTLFDAN